MLILIYVAYEEVQKKPVDFRLHKTFRLYLGFCQFEQNIYST